MGLPKPGNDTMYSIVLLLTEMTILLSFIFFGVLVALCYIIDVFNKATNPYPRHFERTVESTLDVIFVVFPTIIILYLLIPSLGFIFNNEILVETVFNLNIIGHQWYWSYEYIYSLGTSLYGLLNNDQMALNHLEFDSLLDQETTYNRLLQVDKRVIIPINTLIQVTITSQDVIHSWAVPQLGIKYDAIPGRLITFILNSNVEGIYYGQCSELCGVNHGFMPICIQVVEPIIFSNWLLLSSGVNMSYYLVDSVFYGYALSVIIGANIEIVTEPEVITEPEEIVNEPEKTVNEPEKTVNEPETIVIEPEEIVVKPEEIVTEPEEITEKITEEITEMKTETTENINIELEIDPNVDYSETTEEELSRQKQKEIWTRYIYAQISKAVDAEKESKVTKEDTEI